MKTSSDTSQMFFSRDKGGASPGALMTDDNKEYIVKLGIPRVHESYKLNDYNDVDLLTKEMSRRACDEKIFFNIAQAVGDNKYILPETDIVFMQPSEYSESSCSVRKSLANKFDVSNIEVSLEESSYTEVIDRINSTEIAHFRSEMIASYQDIGGFYRYHIQNSSVDMIKDKHVGSLPLEPKGMGAFFALNNFMGNYDCIGASGGNVGFDSDSHKLIIVDGGEARTTHKINKLMPSSANNKTWLSYDDLSDEDKKEASETFVRIANIDDLEIRSLVTNNEQFVDSSIFTEEEIERKIGNFKHQQSNVVETYYDSMVKEGCHINSKIITLKEEIDARLAIEQQEKNILGKREEDDSFKPSKLSSRRVKLKIDPESELIIKNIGEQLRGSGITPKNMEISPSEKENTPERLNRGGGPLKVR
jgi:hypothetical protein